MTLAFAHLPCPDSPLQRLDARWKLATLTLAVIAITCLRTLPGSIAALLSAGALAALGRLPFRWYAARLGVTLLFLLPFVLTLPFLLSDVGAKPLWLPSWRGTSAALALTAKALALVTLVLVLLASAPLNVTLKAAHSLRVPGLLIQLCMLTYRYVFVVAEELSRLRVALRVRGYRNRATRHSYRTVGHVAGTLLVRSHERGERVSQAMRCRGFDGRFRALADFRTTLKDVAFFVVVAASVSGLLLWDFLARRAV